MRTFVNILIFLILIQILIFTGCGEDPSTRPVPSLETKVSAVFGPAGGTLTIPANGSSLFFRENSLSSTVTVTIEIKGTIPGNLPAGEGTAVGSYHNITPPGIAFGENVTLGLPTNGETGISIYTFDGNSFVNRGGTVSGNFIYIQLEGFNNPNSFNYDEFGAVVVKK